MQSHAVLIGEGPEILTAVKLASCHLSCARNIVLDFA